MHRLSFFLFLFVFFLFFVWFVLLPVRAQAQETPDAADGAAKPDPAAPLLRPIPQDPEAYERLVKRAQELVKQLGADSFTKREAATKKLRAIGCRSTEVLKDALDDADVETQFRAKLILDSLLKSKVIVRDGLGHSIPDATVEFFSGEGEKLASHKTDECGSLSLPGFSRLDYEAKDRNAYAIIHHKDYGIARTQLRFNHLSPEEMHLKTGFYVSLIHKESPAAKRALRAQIVDEDGQPIAGVEVRCRDSRTIDGANAMRPRYPQTVMTDDEGRFALYLNQLTLRLRPTESNLIPEKMDYQLQVIAKEPRFPWAGKMRTGDSNKIALTGFEEGASRQFQIQLRETDNRPLDVSQNAYALKISYKQPDHAHPGNVYPAAITSERFLSGRLANGRYFVRWQKRNFPELVISDESPEDIVLTLPGNDGRTFRGKVLDAITGEPFEGAIVVATTASCEREVYTLTDEEWSLLERQKVDSFDGDASKLIQSMYGDEMVATRSRDDGSFEVRESVKDDAYSIVVMARGMLVMKQGCTLIGQLRAKGLEWPTFQMMPFAYVDVGIPGEQTIRASGHWIILDSKHPRVRKYFSEDRNVDADLAATPSIRFGKNTRTIVPADVKMQLQLSSGKDNLARLRIPKVFELSPGEELDLGSDHVFPEKVQVQVQVVDENDKPLESMPVRPRIATNRGLSRGRKYSYGLAVLTTIRGESSVLVEPDDAAVKVTGIHWSNPLKDSKNVEVEFNAAEKPDGPIIIKLTDEQIDAIRNPKPIK